MVLKRTPRFLVRFAPISFLDNLDGDLDLFDRDLADGDLLLLLLGEYFFSVFRMFFNNLENIFRLGVGEDVSFVRDLRVSGVARKSGIINIDYIYNFAVSSPILYIFTVSVKI